MYDPPMPTDPRALSTRCIHGGQYPDPGTGAVMPPISLASTYAQSSPGRHQGYAYARGQNPTRFALERCIASLEETPLTDSDDLTHGGFAFASGLAATAVALDLLESGDHVVAGNDLYGGTFRLLTGVRERSQGLNVTYVDVTDPARFESYRDAVGPALAKWRREADPVKGLRAALRFVRLLDQE